MSHNTNTADAKANTPDLKITGDPDAWELVCKASSASQGWMKSTKRMRVDGGWLYQVSTEHTRTVTDDYDLVVESYVSACAEALVFVPDPS